MTATDTQLLLCSVGGRRLGLPIDRVREVLRAVALSPPVGDNTSAEGLLNLRGRSVGVIDMRALLHLQPQEISAAEYLVVVDDGHRAAAFRADSAPVIRQIAAEQWDACSSESASDMFSGTARIDEAIVPILDGAALLNVIHNPTTSPNQ